ncbi:GntR family transcriptional regulator [Georgenia alba]|uniref:GntR family transcriptional regulator n=1 Tax=Georgenia alba TaxID=2233858 RepID=A0ABW2Q4K9_9MICO
MDLIAAALRESILSGRLPGDQVLVERRLAAELGVSKTPVREALIQLTASGLVTTTRNRGSVVRRLSAQDARHVYEQRLLLEPWAYAESIRTGRIDTDEASKHLERSELLRARADWPAAVLANRAFHQCLYGACPNPLIVESLDRLQDLTALATVSVVWDDQKMTSQEQSEHRRLLELAVAGSADEGEQLMHDHIRRALDSRTDHLS